MALNKYPIIVILVFITINCFAVDQKLIDGARNYETAVEKLKEIEDGLRERGYIGLWSSEEMRNYNPDRIDETNERWNDLEYQYNEAKKTVEKYKPIKNKYDKQKDIEFENEQLKTSIMIGIAIFLIIVTFFGFMIWLAISQQKKYQKLLKEGKISQAEYDSIMSPPCKGYTPFRDDTRTNPATGFRMIGGCDVGGNPYGCPFSNSNNSTSEPYKTRWD